MLLRRRYVLIPRSAFSMTTLCAIALCANLTGCQKHNHPNTPAGTREAVKESLDLQKKAIAEVKPDTAAPACTAELKDAAAALSRAPGSDEALKANLALMRCNMQAANAVRCAGKVQPCGIVLFNPPPSASQPTPQPEMVDVSLPDKVTAACGLIGAAAGVTSGADPKTAVTLGSIVGKYTCGAYFAAAAKNDPTLLIAPQFVPTVQLTRDLKAMTSGTVDLTPEEAKINLNAAVQRSVVTVNVGGAQIPVGVLPIIPVGGTPGKVLDNAAGGVQSGVNKVFHEIDNFLKKPFG